MLNCDSVIRNKQGYQSWFPFGLIGANKEPRWSLSFCFKKIWEIIAF